MSRCILGHIGLPIWGRYAVRNVDNTQPTLRNNPEELISQLHSRDSLRFYWTNVKQTEFNFGADSQYQLQYKYILQFYK
jgi:hypothetical protein